MADEQAGQRPARSIGGWAAILATIIGIFASLNTALAAWSKDQMERSVRLREAVRGEEAFWSELYGQYVEAVGNQAIGDAGRRARLNALAALARHEVPQFREFGSVWGDDPQAAPARKHLEELRKSLRDALTNSMVVPKDVAQTNDFILASGTAQRMRVGEAVTVGALKATETAASQPQGLGQTEATRTLAVGSTTGWDVDVFWCSGAGERTHHRQAGEVALLLAAAALRQDELAPGVRLGRIRQRVLPPTAANADLYFTRGNGIVADASKGEPAAAAAVRRLLDGRSSVRLTPVTSLGTPTPWYISIFLCRTDGSPAPGRDRVARS